MSGVGDINFTSPTKQGESLGRSLAINTESSHTGQKSQKSLKSPVSLSGGVSFRSSVGMFNLDLAQDLASMQKKKEKLQELVTVMKNKKQKIHEKEQMLGSEINRKNELENRIRMLEEQKIARNMGEIIDPKIKQIENTAGAIRDKELELQQAINSITLSLKSRRAQQDQQVQILIKQTNQLNNQLVTSDKQLDLAKKKSALENASVNDKSIEQVIELQDAIIKLQESVSLREKDLETQTQRRSQIAAEAQNAENNLKAKLAEFTRKKEQLTNKINGLVAEKELESNQLLTLKNQESKSYQTKLQTLRNKNSSLKVSKSQNDGSSINNLKSQEQQALKEIQTIESKSSSINVQNVQKQIQFTSEEINKLSEKFEKSKHNEEQNSTKAKEIHQYTQLISRLTTQLKELSEQTKSIAGKKQEAANFLVQQKNKYQAAIKENEFHQLQNQLDKIKRKLNDQKSQYVKLQSLNKDFVPATMIQEYKNKNAQYEAQVKELTALKNNSESMAKQVQQLKEEKTRLQWADNQTALDLEASIKALKNKRGNCLADNKDLHKKVTLAQIKVKEYKEAYPSFEIKIEKKSNKKKNADVVVQKQVKEIQSPAVVPEPKQVKKNEKKKQQHQVAPVFVQQVPKVAEPVQVKSAPAAKSKKQKKITTEAKQQQTLIEQILDRQNEEQDPLLSRTQTDQDNKKKKSKKQKVVKPKKNNKEQSKSSIEQELEYLSLSTKQETKTFLKLPQLIALLVVLFGGSAYWFFS